MEDKIKELKSRYSKVLQMVIDNAIFNFSSTRKGHKVAERKITREFEYWAKFPIRKVIGAMVVYNMKKPYLKGCDERYLRGIIRNINDYEIRKLQLFTQEQLDELFKKLKEEIIGKCLICKGEGYIFRVITELRPQVCKCLNEFETNRLKILKENRFWLSNLGEI